MGKPFKLRLPGIDRLVNFILEKGRHCLVFKKDLQRAYRQFPIDPKDYNLLGFSFQGRFYFETHCPFSLRTSAMICQRTTKVVVHIFTEQGFSADVYLDDFYGADHPSLAHQAFSRLGQLFLHLGLDSSPEKDSPPSTSDLSWHSRQYSRIHSRGSYHSSRGFTSITPHLASSKFFHQETASVPAGEVLLRNRLR